MSQKVKVHIALWIVTLIYAATFSIAKQVMPLYIKPFGFILLRVSVASILILVFHKIFVRERIKDKADLLKMVVCAVFGVAANMLLFFKGLAITTPINGAILMVTTPLFVGFFSFFILKEKATFIKVLGLLLGLTGAMLLLIGPKLSFSSSTGWCGSTSTCPPSFPATSGSAKSSSSTNN